MERRAHLRVPSSVRFRYQIIEMPLKNPMRDASLFDLSAGGAAFKAEGLSIGDVLKIQIYVPDYHKSIAEKPVLGKPITTLGKVVRAEGDKTAVSFVGTYERDKRDLMEYAVRKSYMIRHQREAAISA